MINLLPPKNKEELLQEESWKIVIILGINILAVFVCFSLILYSINIFIEGEVGSQKIIYEQKEKELTSPQMQSLEQGLTAFNKMLSGLDQFYQNQYRVTISFKELAEAMPPDIYLTNLSFNLKTANGKIIEGTFSGFAPSRESLLEFKERLERKASFEEVHFPPAVWIKSADINFQASFKIDPTKSHILQ